MDMFEYIATANPAACQQLCEQYGYQAQATDTGELADCISQLIQAEGEPALRDLTSLHPDKVLILEQFSSGAASGGPAAAKNGGSCGCSGCQKNGRVSRDQLLQLSQGHHTTQTQQAGIFIIGGLLVLALAVISTKS